MYLKPNAANYCLLFDGLNVVVEVNDYTRIVSVVMF